MGFDFEDSPAEDFRDVGDDGVSESPKSVHPAGNPMNASANRGFNTRVSAEVLPPGVMFLGAGRPWVAAHRFALSPRERFPGRPWNFGCFSPSEARSVGQNEEAGSKLGGAHVARAQHTPFRIVPEAGHVPEYAINSPVKESCHVLHDDVSGSNQANDPGELGPEARPLPVEAGAGPSVGNVLAGEPADNGVCPGEVAPEASHVGVAGDPGPMAGEDLAGPRVSLALPHGPETTGPLKAKLKASDSGEEAADSQHTPSPSGPPSGTAGTSQEPNRHVNGRFPVPGIPASRLVGVVFEQEPGEAVNLAAGGAVAPLRVPRARSDKTSFLTLHFHAPSETF